MTATPNLLFSPSRHTDPSAPGPALLPCAATGVITAEATLDWVTVAASARAATAHWRSHGLRPGDRVLHAAGNTATDAVTLLALAHADASVVLLDPRETPAEARRVASLTRTRWVVADGPFPPASLGEDLRRLPAVDLGASAVPGATSGPSSSEPELDLRAWSARYDALVAWSSGSTGRPKGVLRSGAALLDNLDATAARLRYRPGDVLLPLLSISHQYGLSLLLLAWRTGTGVVLGRPDRPDGLLRLGATAGATVVDATPSTYHALLALDERRPGTIAALADVRLWCTGGARLGAELAQRFEARAGRPLLDGYGSTEAGNIALASDDDRTACGTALDGVHVRVVDDADRELAAGAAGRLQVRSPYLYSALLDDAGDVVPRPEGWYDTGDIGSLDAAGRVTVLGRRDAVHCLGHVVYPDALARRVSAATGLQVEVVAVEDARRGSALVFVVADATGRTIPAELTRSLLPHERPVHTVTVAHLPLGRTGKPDRAQLRALATARLRRSAVPSPRVPGVPLAERAAALRAVHDEVSTSRARFVEVLAEVGTQRAAQLEVDAFLHTLAGALDEVGGTRPRLLDRLAVFLPSNILLYSMALHVLVPSLYVDRVVARPSRQVTAQTRRLHELLAPVHGLPVELVTCTQREFVDGHVQQAQACVFTGTYANAEQVRRRLRADQLFVFFGQGINPFVVAPGADLERAVEDLLTVRLINSGQDCLAPDVVFVHESLAAPFLERLTARLSGLRFGHGDDPAADYGPLHYEESVQATAQYLHRHRTSIVFGGAVDFRRRVVQPTVVRAAFDERLAPSEVFAPVFTVVDYADAAALRARLTSPYYNERALGATVHGRDPELVATLRRRHTVSVDTTLLALEDGNAPFGGAGVRANYVAHAGRRTARPLLLSQVVAEHLGRSS